MIADSYREMKNFLGAPRGGVEMNKSAEQNEETIPGENEET